MTIYLIHFLLLALYTCIYAISPRTKTARLLFIFICFFQTFLLYALRGAQVGTDTYPMAKDYIFPFMDLAHKAPLYQLLSDTFRWIIPYSQGYMIMCGIFIVGGTAGYIYYNSKNVVLSLFIFFSLYFFFFAMNGARQSISIVLGAYALVFIGEQRKFPAFFLLACAVGIHSTAIILVPFLSLLFIQSISKRHLFFFLYAFLLLGFAPLTQLFISIFSDYASYMNSGYLFEVGQNRKILLTLFYAFLLCGGAFTYYRTKNKNTQQENIQWEILLSCLANTVIIGILALRSMLFTRLEYYFSFTLILFIPLILSKFKRNNQLWLQFTVYLVIAIPGLFQFMSNYGEILPYYFFWE